MCGSNDGVGGVGVVADDAETVAEGVGWLVVCVWFGSGVVGVEGVGREVRVR